MARYDFRMTTKGRPMEQTALRDFEEGDYVIREASSAKLVRHVHNEGCRVTLFLADGTRVSGAPGRTLTRQQEA